MYSPGTGCPGTGPGQEAVVVAVHLLGVHRDEVPALDDHRLLPQGLQRGPEVRDQTAQLAAHPGVSSRPSQRMETVPPWCSRPRRSMR